MIKATLTGPHSTGKTTILTDLKSKGTINLTYLPEITRVIHKQGFTINEHGTNETQLLIITTHLHNLFLNENFIVDRCLLDGFVYTQWLFNQGLIDEWILNFAKQSFLTYIDNYSHIFYIPKEFEIVSDGIRSADIQFHKDICKLFKETIDKYSISVYTVTGSREERVASITRILKEMK